MALRTRDPVDERARRDRALGRGPRAEQRREKAVEPLARRLSRDVHRAATSIVRRGGVGARSLPGEREEQDHDADDDERVGEIEDAHAPPVQVDEVGDVAEADAVEEVREAPADQQAEGRRQGGMARPGAREEDDIQTIAPAVTTVTIGVAPANSPNAMPEFWTWWIESGPST